MYLKSKRISILVLAAFLFSVFMGFGNLPASAATTPSDVYGSWAYNQISSLMNQGIVSGYPDGTFKPDNTVSRAEFMSMVNRAYGFNATAAIAFSDVKPGDWFYNDVAKAKAAGYISGYNDGTMKPNQNIERQEAAVIIAKVAKLSTQYGALPFIDAGSIPTWSWMSITAMVNAKLLSGYPDGTFKPTASVTRAEAATMLYNALKKVEPPPPVPVNKELRLSDSSIEMDTDDEVTIKAYLPDDVDMEDIEDVDWDSDDDDIADITDYDDDNSNYIEFTVESYDEEDDTTITIIVKTDDKTYKADLDVSVEENGGRSGSEDLDLSDDSIDMDTYDEVVIKAYLPDDVDMDDVEDVSWDSDDDDIADIDDYDDDNSSYIEFTVESYGEEGDTTIEIEIETDDDTYTALLDVEVEEGGGDGEGRFTLSDDSIDMDTEDNDEKTVTAWLPDDLEMGDIVDINWDSEDQDIADIIDYDDTTSEDSIDFYVVAYDEGNTTITITIETTEGDYDLDLDVDVDNGDSSDDLTLEDYNVTVDRFDYIYVDAELDGADGDIDELDYDIDGDPSGIEVDFDDVENDTFRIRIEGNDYGDYTVHIYVTTDEDEDYDVDLDVTVD